MAFTLASGHSIQVTEDRAMADGLGGEVWEGARYLCRRLDTLAAHQQLQGKAVLELGAGTGLCSLVAAALGAHIVIATDEFPDLICKNVASFISGGASAAAQQVKDCAQPQQQRQRVAIAVAGGGDSVPAAAEQAVHLLSSSTQLYAEGLAWGDPPGPCVSARLATGGFDYIIGSEIIPMKGGHEPLLAALCANCGTHTVVLFTVDVCPGGMTPVCTRARICSTHHFLKLASAQGFVCAVEEAEVQLSGEAMAMLVMTRGGAHAPEAPHV